MRVGRGFRPITADLSPSDLLSFYRLDEYRSIHSRSAASLRRAELPLSKMMKRQKIGLACDACREHKKRCSGATPCARCQRLSRECTYRDRTLECGGTSVSATRSGAMAPTVGRGSGNSDTPGLSCNEAAISSSTALIQDPSSSPSEPLVVEASTGHCFGPISPFSWVQRAREQLGQAQFLAPAALPATSPMALDGGMLSFGDRVQESQTKYMRANMDILQDVSDRCLDLVVAAYFEQAMATYHFLHLQSVKGWIQDFRPGHHGKLNDAKRAVCWLTLAHGMLHLKAYELGSLAPQNRTRCLLRS